MATKKTAAKAPLRLTRIDIDDKEVNFIAERTTEPEFEFTRKTTLATAHKFMAHARYHGMVTELFVKEK